MSSAKTPRVFISYSHRGHGPEWKSKLLHALHVFESQHLLDIWQDGKIRVSSFWDDDIKKAMSQADIAIVLLTQESLESEYILNVEFPYLRDRQLHDNLTVLPVICEECDWRPHDWLRATQAPNGSNPLSALPANSQGRIFRQLATDVAEQLSKVALAHTSAETVTETCVFLDKFSLTKGPSLREDKLIGRDQELALLDLAFTQPHTAIVSLVAWGGVGKTMLVQHWLRRLESERWCCASKVYAWSFYSQGTTEDRQASEDMFLAHALDWFGVQCEPTLSPWDKGRLLADVIARNRTLLILDGIEPLQYPPGPMGGQLRAAGVQSLLKHLARTATRSENRGLCIATTREPLSDLVDFQRYEGGSWGSVLRVDLGNLTDDAGAALLHHAGAKRMGVVDIQPGDKELLAASREVDGHALTLNLLGRFLSRAYAGDIKRRDLVEFNEADRSEQGGTTFRMLNAFEKWFAKGGFLASAQLAVLRILGLFDRPADPLSLAELRKPPVVTGITDPLFHAASLRYGDEHACIPIPEEEWNTVISFLNDFGLISHQGVSGQEELDLDCHPLIREYFHETVSVRYQEGAIAAQRRVCLALLESAPESAKWTEEDAQLDLLMGRAGDFCKQRPTVHDLLPVYRSVYHGCKAMLHIPVHEEIYVQMLARGTENYACTKLGAWAQDISVLRHFFSTPWTEVLSIFATHTQVSLLKQASRTLRALGRLRESAEAMQKCLELTDSPHRYEEIELLESLGEIELAQGEISKAILIAEKVFNTVKQQGDMQHYLHRFRLANVLHQSGREGESSSLFQGHEGLERLHLTELQYIADWKLSPTERNAWRKQMGVELAHQDGVLNSDFRDIQGLKEEHATWEWAGGFPLVTVAGNRVLLGRAALLGAILEGWAVDSAETLLSEAVNLLRESGILDQVPRGLMLHAWLKCFVEGPSLIAQNDLDEASDMSARGAMLLNLADVHLYRARLFFREKTYPWKSPQDDLNAAEKLINECGYHRRDKELEDAKLVILGKV